MDVSRFTHEDHILVDRSPDEVYAIVSDVTRIGELSPVCVSASWDDPEQAGQEGAWFTGHNAIGEFTWDTRCRVVVADPGREFAFVNYGMAGEVELVRWGYRFDADGDATRVTETWQVLPAYPDFVRQDNPDADDETVAARIEGLGQMARDGIKETLENLKQLAEA